MEKRILEEISAHSKFSLFSELLPAGARSLRAGGEKSQSAAIHPRQIFTFNTELSVLPVASVQQRHPSDAQTLPACSVRECKFGQIEVIYTNTVGSSFT